VLAGVGLAVVFSVAALIVSLMRGGGDASPGPAEPNSANTEPLVVFADDADRELCKSMGSTMNEQIDAMNTLQDSTQQNTPERKAAIPAFVNGTYEWARKAQDVLNQHSDPPRFLTTIYQRYIHDTLLFAEQLAPDRDASAYENQLYEQTLKDLAGLIGRCSEVDVRWWKVR
jgi:hypothetical protein